VRQAVSQGSWLEAREGLRLLEDCSSDEWSPVSFAQEMLQPISISSLVEKLDAQRDEQFMEFIAFALHLGDAAVDCLTLVLAETQIMRLRRVLAEAIAGLCRENPERLAPYLSDPRWYVVRNIVHILGWIGGTPIVGLLQTAVRHSDNRVKREVVAALGTVEPRLARPVLIRLLEGADPKRFCAVLHQLSSTRDAGVARLLFGYVQDPQFEQRSMAERQAIYNALGATAGDESVAELEAELHRGNWFSRNAESHRASLARAIARIGTAHARVVLERGAQSRRPPVRKACADALVSFGSEANGER
jgi:HEAT repeat protein